MAGAVIEIDGETIHVPETERPAVVADLKRDDQWQLADPRSYREGLKKRIGLHGPIDDAFMDSFLVVVPTGYTRNAMVRRTKTFHR